jgi:hypothetical protein
MSILPVKKTGRGRPRVDSDRVEVRFERGQLDALDAWRALQSDAPGRPEAIRRLIELGLKAAQEVKEPAE